MSGMICIVTLVSCAAAADVLAVNSPQQQFSDYVFAPPMPVRVRDAQGRWQWPFVYPLRLENRLERRFVEDRERPMPLRFFQSGAFVAVDGFAPWFPLGTDGLGRDVFARLARGGRLSLGVSLVAAAAALLIGMTVGGVAGFLGGRTEDLLMGAADLVIALPAIYVVLALRAAAPLVLSTIQVFLIMTGVFALAGWPVAARGVRAIVRVERTREYAEAARSLGASSTRILFWHLLPATRGFLVVQATLLVPAFVLAEATMSFIGLGFAEPAASWGVMLQEAGRGHALTETPWLLAPAAAIVLAVFGLNLLAGERIFETAASAPVLKPLK
jgi:peptide/nickel transport system permease protein